MNAEPEPTPTIDPRIARMIEELREHLDAEFWMNLKPPAWNRNDPDEWY